MVTSCNIVILRPQSTRLASIESTSGVKSSQTKYSVSGRQEQALYAGGERARLHSIIIYHVTSHAGVITA